MTRKEATIWLQQLPGIGPIAANLLLQEMEPEEIFSCTPGRLNQFPKLQQKQKEMLLNGREEETPKEIFQNQKKQGITMTFFWEEEYPASLRELPDRPLVLYSYGTLPSKEQPLIGVVGSRDSTTYGREVARNWSRAFAQGGVGVISGLALGIDGMAHEGALEAGGYTLAVLGCGVDICYPKEHYPLYRRILKAGGGILSEYPGGIPPERGHFPARNRLIAGLSRSILVVEAKESSGSLITADLAMDQGRDVYAVPGRVTDLRSKGCLRLIQAGAFLAGGPGDLMEEDSHFQMTLPLASASLTPGEQAIVSALTETPQSADALGKATNLPLSLLLEGLLNLELKGLARQVMRNRFVGTGSRERKG